MKAVLGADAAVPDRLTGGMRREAKRSRAALAADVCRTPDSRLSSESRRRRNIRFWDRQTSSSGVLPVRPGIFRSEFASDTLPAFDRMDRAPDAPLSTGRSFSGISPRFFFFLSLAGKAPRNVFPL